MEPGSYSLSAPSGGPWPRQIARYADLVIDLTISRPPRVLLSATRQLGRLRTIRPIAVGIVRNACR
jgi:hypothetical protein